MTKKFTWEAFSIPFIKSICYSEKTRKNLRPSFDTDNKDLLLPYIDSICSIPDVHFIRKYHSEIIDYFLSDSTHLVTIVRALEKYRYRGVYSGAMSEMVAQIKRLRLTSTVITLILHELYNEGKRIIESDDEISIFGCPKQIDLTSCIPDDIPMYNYQQEAIHSLQQHFIKNDMRAGILSMPTGSGKTRVATRFLLESMVSNGWQVVWLTHRAMLIEQAAASIYCNAGALLRLSAPEKETFKMVCVSGSHASIKATEFDDDVMICSVQTLVRNLPYLQAVLGEKVFVIVDEAHHTLAPSYRLIINEIQKIASKTKLLGLTATPVRLSEYETNRLLSLYDNKTVHHVAMGKLITEGYLSEPHYERVDTNIDFNTNISIDEQRYIQKWGELSADTAERMAQIVERNALIADTYISNRERYGKTLIFALSATHCISLCEELQKRGVKCDYIYCAHPGNADKIARFKSGEIDVLVNIQMLTEGSDVPDIQTVFLTRPTSSDVLLMQMIGRGMRGKGSGGTDTVNIVDFHDNWGSFANWLNPEIITNQNDSEDDDASVINSSHHKENLIPWAMIRDILDGINTTYAIDNNFSFSSLPVGWYDVLDEDGIDCKVLVFESQLSGYIAMFKNKENTLNNPSYTGKEALNEWFDGFGLLPTAHDLQMILDTGRLTGEFPHLYQISKRNTIDATLLAEKIKKQNIGVMDMGKTILSVYEDNKEIIDSIYGDFNNYDSKVRNFVLFPEGIKPLGIKIAELPEEYLTFDATPIYQLSELVEEVINERFDGAYGKLPEISWTKHPYTGYYGQYTYHPDGHYIRINCILNSKDVPRDVVKYVIYHELLHRDFRMHNAAFRNMEHKYPNWTEHERFLDFKFPKFNLQGAM